MIGCGVVAFVECGGRATRIMSIAVPLVDARTAQEAEAAGAAVVVSVYQRALEVAHRLGSRITEPDVFVGDSSNTISFLEGKAKFKAKKVSTWVGGIREALAVSGREVEFRLVPRAMNQAADKLATAATTLEAPVCRIHCEESSFSFGADSGRQQVETQEDVLSTEGIQDVIHQPINLVSSRFVLPRGSY